MTSWRADLSTSASGADGRPEADPELRRCHQRGRHRRPHAGQSSRMRTQNLVFKNRWKGPIGLDLLVSWI
jgi:hypothetical protein